MSQNIKEPEVGQEKENEITIFETDWIKVKRTSKGFDFLERKGKNSVAVFLIRQTQLNSSLGWDVLVRWQPLPIDNEDCMALFGCPITGGIEKGELPETCATRETFEEAGYRADLKYLGRYTVGTQTNERCFMYWADVSELEPQQATQDGTYHESISKNEWQKLEELGNFEYSACQIGFARLIRVLDLWISF